MAVGDEFLGGFVAGGGEIGLEGGEGGVWLVVFDEAKVKGGHVVDEDDLVDLAEVDSGAGSDVLDGAEGLFDGGAVVFDGGFLGVGEG